MVITPNTNIRLLKVPLEISGENQLTFNNATAQYNYFNSLPKLELGNNYTYQRKDGTIRVNGTFDDLYNYNYVMYQNTSHNNKWFYAYITGMEYINDSVTAIKIKTDTWQTWQFNLFYKPVFVEREHVNSDVIGENTVPENLECGEYVIDNNTKIDMGSGTMVVFMVTQPPYDQAPMQYTTHSIGNIFNGLIAFAVRSGDAQRIVSMYDAQGGSTSDAIQNIYLVPEECVNFNQSSTWSYDGISATIFPIQSNTQLINSVNISMPGGFQGYTPKNNKLQTYPFRYFHITNNAGSDIEFKWEDLPKSNGVPYATCYVEAIASCGAQSKLFIRNYKGYDGEASGNNQLFNYGVVGGKLPCCAWKTDYYTNWLTQNGVNIAVNTVVAGVGAGLSVLSGSAVGVVGSAAAVAHQVAEITKAAKVPDQAKGDVSCGDLLYSNQESAFNFYSMSIRYEYARIIDQYLSKYGYKVNRVKIPNIRGRQNWNFVKTIGCYIEANIPQDDLNEIKQQFDSGITLWHNPATFGDYSQNNNIIV